MSEDKVTESNVPGYEEYEVTIQKNNFFSKSPGSDSDYRLSIFHDSFPYGSSSGCDYNEGSRRVSSYFYRGNGGPSVTLVPGDIDKIKNYVHNKAKFKY